MFRTIFRCVREYKSATILTILFITGEAIIEAVIPFITAKMVNSISEGVELSFIIKIGLILVLLTLISLAFGGLAGYTSAKAAAGLSKNLRHDIFEKVQSFAFSNIDKFSSASLVTRLTTDINNVQMAFMMMIRMAVRAPLMLIFSIIMAFIMGGKLAMTFVIVIPFMLAGLLTIAKFAMPAFHRVFKKYDKLNESIEENVRGMRVVKGFSREEEEKKKFHVAAEDICREFTKAERIVACNGPIMQVCLYFNMAFILIVGSRMIITGSGSGINVGDMSSMLTYGFQVLIQLMMLSMVYVMLTLSAESGRRIAEVLNEKTDISNPENAVTEVPNGEISFHDVGFKYSQLAKKFALSDIDITIPSGATVGIIGGTGSSKSTLVQLIPRLYDVTEGTVMVGGIDVRKYDLNALRDSVAMVLQKNVLFSGSIKDNLRWGNPDATDEEMMEACKLAQAHEFIETFPDGYDTMIEQGGTNVSGGQKQRLCIARALLKRPKILILDDSTSAVDTKTDARIRAGFEKFIPDTTKIIIAQRVASVQNSDMIIVLDQGRISAVGTHEELLNMSDIYREVYEQQTNGGDGDAA
ncbi:MAG: ABC transporter ATP-binding protein/permease [Oscillospiraceae bacterium]|nr:ABC transporter ATP-binding protein/permease [Oscillospiraceae bacterium]